MGRSSTPIIAPAADGAKAAPGMRTAGGFLLAGGVLALAAAGLLLWAHVGPQVFLDLVTAGIAWCF